MIEMGDTMNDKELNELYLKAIHTWSIDFQMMMAIEEMAELMQVISKAKRKGLVDVADNFAEEIVDVEILLGQLKVIGGYVNGFDSLLEKYRHSKIEKLRQMLERD